MKTYKQPSASLRWQNKCCCCLCTHIWSHTQCWQPIKKIESILLWVWHQAKKKPKHYGYHLLTCYTERSQGVFYNVVVQDRLAGWVSHHSLGGNLQRMNFSLTSSAHGQKNSYCWKSVAPNQLQTWLRVEQITKNWRLVPKTTHRGLAEPCTVVQ